MFQTTNQYTIGILLASLVYYATYGYYTIVYYTTYGHYTIVSYTTLLF